eukprot:3631986-Rhodomonas_salina.2
MLRPGFGTDVGYAATRNRGGGIGTEGEASRRKTGTILPIFLRVCYAQPCTCIAYLPRVSVISHLPPAAT